MHMCICMCVGMLSVCVSVCVGVAWCGVVWCVCMCEKATGLSLFLSLTPSIFSCMIAYLTHHEVRYQIAEQERPQDPSVSAPLAHAARPHFYLGAGDQNSDPHACVTNVLTH